MIVEGVIDFCAERVLCMGNDKDSSSAGEESLLHFVQDV